MRLRGVEGLRALAALSVLLHHVWLFDRAPTSTPVALPGPGLRIAADLRIGLTLFFVLSGFLLYRPFAAAILRADRLPSVRSYLRNRALRILPAYWVILLASSFVLSAAIVAFPLQIGTITSVKTIVADVLLVQNYRPGTLGTGIGPAWSLAVEFVFYLALPVLAVGAMRLARRVRGRRATIWVALVPAAALLLLGGLSRLAFEIDPPAAGSIYLAILPISFPLQADLFGVGMLAAVALTVMERREVNVARAVPIALTVAGVALIAATLLYLPATGPGKASGWNAVVALGFALVVLACCAPVSRPWLGVRALDSRPAVWAGLCSYSIYLWHTPVIFLLARWGVVADDIPSLALCTLAVLAATLFLSTLTYRFVERPALARKRHAPRRPLPTPDGGIAVPAPSRA
jgi:peptidoglycan/LPS O-acetylase OafA/YrhL